MTQRSILSFNFVNNASNLPLINILFLFFAENWICVKIIKLSVPNTVQKTPQQFKSQSFRFQETRFRPNSIENSTIIGKATFPHFYPSKMPKEFATPYKIISTKNVRHIGWVGKSPIFKFGSGFQGDFVTKRSKRYHQFFEARNSWVVAWSCSASKDLWKSLWGLLCCDTSKCICIGKHSIF